MPVRPKADAGRFFEDFRLSETLRHATARTLTTGDAALYLALTGARFAPQSSAEFARALGYRDAPLDDLLVFHVVFGKSVADVSLNAVANLGYAECRFLAPVHAGDTLASTSEVIGLRENANGRSGIVYVRTRGANQRGETVLEFVRWVMVAKRDPAAPAPATHVPDLAPCVSVQSIGAACPRIDPARWDAALAGSPHRWSDYAPGERIDHIDGMTIEEAEHQMATRLYQNVARVHFDAFNAANSRFGKRLIYGGHAMSIARALSFNGLGAAFHIAAINAGRHVAPLFAGDTVFAWSEILECAELDGRSDVGALRVRTTATKNRPCADFPHARDDNADPAVVLELDYWALTPR